MSEELSQLYEILKTRVFSPYFDAIVRRINELEIKEFQKENNFGGEPEIKSISINNSLNNI